MAPRKVRLLFVCLGNICRSPTAEAVMRHQVKRADLSDVIDVDSAGTGDWHVGNAPDARSAATGRKRGVPLSGHARQVRKKDFTDFDLVLAMDVDNRANLHKLAPDAGARERVHLLRDFDPDAGANADVPDPYYGGPDGFDNVFDICERACTGLLEHVRKSFLQD